MPRRRNPPPAAEQANPAQYAQPGYAIGPPVPTQLCDLCHAHYIPTEEGMRTHLHVFGHRPDREGA
jgi:hypothetical protein